MASHPDILRRFIFADSLVQTTERTLRERLRRALGPADYLPLCAAPAFSGDFASYEQFFAFLARKRRVRGFFPFDF